MIKRRRHPFFVVMAFGIVILIGTYLFFGSNNETVNTEKPQSQHVNGVLKERTKTDHEDVHTYNLEAKKWGIYTNGTHAKETTNGMNKALQWAKNQGYTTFYVPPGTYLISKGTSESDQKARINLVSNMTFLLDDKAVIQKETNGFEIYSTLYLDPDVENVTIKGGTLRGDKETHDYSQKGEHTDGTHEWGNGIMTAGARNIVVDSVKIEKFTGDGIEIGGSTIFGNYITEQELEIGGIDDKGQPVSEKGKIRSNNYNVTNFNNPAYKNPHYRNLMMWIPEGVEGTYDLVYYRKDGGFIKKDKGQRFNSTWGYSKIPEEADYFRVVFKANSTKDVKVNRMTVAITENMTIKNCDIGYNRRQGITVGASDNIKIIDNKIHHIKGTAPESGIDIEPGFYPAINTLIRGNHFSNNKIHMVFSYGGNATVKENDFEANSSDGIGFSINPSYYGAVVENNNFNHSSFVTWGKTRFDNNELISSVANFEGGTEVFVNGIVGIDSSINIKQTEKNGIHALNISLKSSKKQNQKGGLSVFGRPIKITSINLTGNNQLGGDGNNKNVYDQVSFYDTPEMSLPLGTYNECSSNSGIFSLSKPGKIELNKCQFKNTILYTYNQDMEAVIQDSQFDIEENIGGPILLAMEAKRFSILNNEFNIKTSKKEKGPVIQIGRDASEKDSTKVFGTTVKGNKISTNYRRIGIDSINGGVGAPGYLIESNILYNASLNLKANDHKTNNQIINKN